MTVFVVDTNVAIVANGRGTHADEACQLSCVKRLQSLVKEEELAIDEGGLIFDEYKRRLSFSGAEGAGDAFFKHVFINQFGGRRIRLVPVSQSDDSSRGLCSESGC